MGVQAVTCERLGARVPARHGQPQSVLSIGCRKDEANGAHLFTTRPRARLWGADVFAEAALESPLLRPIALAADDVLDQRISGAATDESARDVK